MDKRAKELEKFVRTEESGLSVASGIGMTETSSPGLIGSAYKYYMYDWPDDRKFKYRLRTGYCDTPLAEVTVRDLNNMEEDVPKNNKTTGEMLFRSPWCTLGYFKDPERSKELWHGGIGYISRMYVSWTKIDLSLSWIEQRMS